MAAKKAIYSILDLKGNVIQNVGAPSLDTDVATKASAGADATTKANAAQAAAEATAASLATAAQNAAISTAATDASTKATTAKTEAIAAAAIDASTKATTAENNAKAYVDSEITELIGGATGAYDTLKELETALLNDASAIAALTTSIGTVSTNLATEVTNRTNADNALDGRLDTAESSITTLQTNVGTLQTDVGTINTSLASKLQIATGTANGSGTSTAEGYEYTIDHNLNKANVIAQVYDGNDVVDVVIRKVNNNSLKLITGSALGATTLTVVVAG